MSSRKGPKEVSRAEELSVEMMPKLSSSGISARAAGAPSVAPSAAASATVTAGVVTVLSIVVSLLLARKSVVWGKRVSVSGDLGGWRSINKKKQQCTLKSLYISVKKETQ